MSLNGYLNFLKSLINHIIKIAFIFFILQICASAQQSILQDENKSNEDTSAYVMTKSPWGAVLRSAIIPGWGQIYAGSYIKAPIIWGIGAGLAAAWIWNNNKYWTNAKLYAEQGYPNIDNFGYKRNRDFFRDQRDLVTIYMALAYFLNLVDAYVDAALFDFNVSENFYTHQPMIGFKLNF